MGTPRVAESRISDSYSEWLYEISTLLLSLGLSVPAEARTTSAVHPRTHWRASPCDVMLVFKSCPTRLHLCLTGLGERLDDGEKLRRWWAGEVDRVLLSTVPRGDVQNPYRLARSIARFWGSLASDPRGEGSLEAGDSQHVFDSTSSASGSSKKFSIVRCWLCALAASPRSSPSAESRFAWALPLSRSSCSCRLASLLSA
mmetsp:Transcript_18762/g.43295  ORF Transcript_18762/g.43295 Transcript_18762/m.43295 type:complete len:200 (-) Transcript_18762:98-697(-)